MKTFPCLKDNDLILAPLVHEDAQTIREWRNAERSWFFDQHVIEPDEQERWWTKYAADPTDYIWTAYLIGHLVGMASLYHIDVQERVAEWGRLLVTVEAQGQGLGLRMAVLIRDYALDSLKLERLYCSSYHANFPAMSVHMRAGYAPYRTDGNVTHMVLHREDWR